MLTGLAIALPLAFLYVLKKAVRPVLTVSERVGTRIWQLLTVLKPPRLMPSDHGGHHPRSALPLRVVGPRRVV